MGFSYESKPVLSKIRIGENYYYLKDADLRAIVNGFNAQIVQGTIGVVSDNDNSFVTAQSIKAYVDSAVAVGLVIEVVDTLPEASADEMGKIYLVADEHVQGDNYDEYIIVRTGTEGSYVYNWEKIGNTDIDLSGYVSDVKYEDKTLKVQKGKGTYDNIHIFGDFADASTGEGKVDTVDSASFDYTPEGEVNVTLQDTETSISSTGNFLPKGSINGDAIKGGSIEVTLQDSTTKSAAELTFDAYKPEGIVTNPTINVTAETKEVQFVDDLGTLPTFTEGAFTAAEIKEGFYTAGSLPSYSHSGFNGGSLGAASKDTFAKEGIKASVGTEGDDEETLIIESATTGNAVTEQGAYTAAVYGTDTFNAGAVTIIDTSKFSGGSKTADKFGAGTLPTLKAAESIMIGATATATGATFNGTSANIKLTSAKYVKPEIKSAEFTSEAATLSFTGTEEAVNVTGNYMKQSVASATFTGAAVEDKVIDLVKSEKTIAVNPKK